jgi:putative membrane protein
MWGYMGDGGWWWWGFGALHMLLFWCVLIFVIVVAVKWLSGTQGQHRPPDSGGGRALDILKERYARGEINKEEFEQKKRDLQG